MNDLSDKFKRERFLSRMSVLSIVAAVILMLTVFTVLLMRIGAFAVPDFLKPLFGTEDSSETESLYGDEDALYEALTVYNEKAFIIDLGNDADILSLFEISEPITEYTLTNTVTYSGGGRTRLLSNKIWRSENRYRLETYDTAGELIRQVVCDGEQIALSEFSQGELRRTRSFPVSDSFSMEAAAGFLSISALQERLGRDDNGLENLHISLIRGQENNAYCITFYDAVSQCTEELSVSLEYALIIESATYFQDSCIYHLATTSVTPGLTGYTGDDIFTLSP